MSTSPITAKQCRELIALATHPNLALPYSVNEEVGFAINNVRGATFAGCNKESEARFIVASVNLAAQLAQDKLDTMQAWLDEPEPFVIAGRLLDASYLIICIKCQRQHTWSVQHSWSDGAVFEHAEDCLWQIRHEAAVAFFKEPTDAQ